MKPWTGTESGVIGEEPRAFSICVVNYNGERYLAETLGAVFNQCKGASEVLLVDNASEDGTAARISERYPEVRLIVMPHSNYGACETFNIGFASSTTPLTAILDDDVVLPPEWLERSIARLSREPESTAILSTEVVEPGMPESYLEALDAAGDRYMSTFRGCASLGRARSDRVRRG